MRLYYILSKNNEIMITQLNFKVFQKQFVQNNQW